MADQNSSGEGRRWTIHNVSKRFTVEKANASPIPLGSKVEVAPVSELERVEAERDELRNSSKVSENAELKKLLEQEEATREGVEEALKESERINDFDVRVALAEANKNTRAAQALYEELKAGVEAEVERLKKHAKLHGEAAGHRREGTSDKAHHEAWAKAERLAAQNLTALLNPSNLSLAETEPKETDETLGQAPCETCGGCGEIRPRDFHERKRSGFTVPCPTCTTEKQGEAEER